MNRPHVDDIAGAEGSDDDEFDSPQGDTKREPAEPAGFERRNRQKMILLAVGGVLAFRNLANLGKVGVEIFRSVVDVGPMQSCDECADDDAHQRSGADASGDHRDGALPGGSQKVPGAKDREKSYHLKHNTLTITAITASKI